jgi:phosphinothricin acetyltransferase
VSATIRLAEVTDAAAIAAIYRPSVEGSVTSFELVPPDAPEMARRIEATLRGYPWLVCELRGSMAGYAYAGRHRERAAYRWSAEVSVYIGEAYRRRGVGRGLYRSLFAILAAQGYVNLYAGVTLPNTASVRLHEAVGFEPVGVYRGIGHKYGAWHDVGWWQMALGAPREATPAEPVELATVRRRADFGTLLAAGESCIVRD